MLLGRLELVLDVAAPPHRALCIGEVLVGLQIAIDALEHRDRGFLPFGQVRRGDHAGHLDAQRWELVGCMASGRRRRGRRGLVGLQVCFELLPARVDACGQFRIGLVPAVAFLHQFIAVPLGRHEEDARAAGDLGLLLHLHLVVQRQVGTGAAVYQRRAQVIVQGLVFERQVLHEGQPVEAGGVLALNADAGVQLRAEDGLSQRPRQRLEPVAGVEALLGGVVDFLAHTGGALAQQLGARLVGRQAEHRRRVAGVPMLGPVGVPGGCSLDELHDPHGCGS